MSVVNVSRRIRSGDLVKINYFVGSDQSTFQEYLILDLIVIGNKTNIFISPKDDEYSSSIISIIVDDNGTIIDKIPGLHQIEYVEGSTPGTVYVAAMNMRGKRAPKPEGTMQPHRRS